MINTTAWPRLGTGAFAVAAIAAVVAMTAPRAGAAAPTYYVDAASRGGKCSDARTPAQNTLRTPWCTLARGITAATAGSSVLVRAAAYPRTQVTGAVKGAYVTIAPYGSEVPTINGLDLVKSGFLRFEGLKTVHGVVVRESHDLHFVGGEAALMPRGSGTPNAFTFLESRNLLIADNFIHDGFNAIILNGVGDSVKNAVVRGNRIQRMGADGIVVGKNNADITVEGNALVDVKRRADMVKTAHSDALQVTGPTTNVRIAGNVVTGGRGFIFGTNPTDHKRVCCGHVNTVVENNLITGYEFAMKAWSFVNGRIVNNTFWGTSETAASGLHIYDRNGSNHRTTGLVFANNVVRRLTVGSGVGFAVRDFNVIKIGPLGGARDVQGVPDFVDPLSFDYHLDVGSVGVNAATSRYAPPTDAQGKARYGAPDTGALELHP